MDTAESGEEALHALAAGEHYDAVFLDVRMPGLDGVELARLLRRFAVAARADLRLRLRVRGGRGVRAAGARLPDEAGQHRAGRRGAEPDRAKPHEDTTETLAVDAPGGGTKLLQRADILYLQAHGDYVRVVTADGRYLVRGTLNEIERRWAPHGFHRVHRRFLVNLRRAAEVRPQLNGTAMLILADGAELPIARREVAELRRRLRS